MSSLIYKCDESMGAHHWETQVYVSDCGKEVSFIQTWFDGTDIQSQQNVVMMSKEIKKVATVLTENKEKS